MGRKIFVSYKYGDDSVANLTTCENSIVRNYVDKLEELFEETDHIYKGEHDGEDLSNLSESTIKDKLRNRIYDSSLTIVFISPKMKDPDKSDREQWIPWEVSFSLKETSRRDSSGNAITSHSNAMIAIVLPDAQGEYNYSLELKTCCQSSCMLHHRDWLFEILKDNMFNYRDAMKKECKTGGIIWSGPHSYIETIKWCDFIKDPEKYISRAYERQKNIDSYEIQRELQQ